MKESTVYIFKTFPETQERDVEKVLKIPESQELNPRCSKSSKAEWLSHKGFK